MARPLRVEYEGALYHVTSRGNARQNIFLDEQDRKEFLKTLSEVVERYRWIVHVYCLMNNHYHLLVETPQGNLSSGMRQLNGVYTQRFNRRHGRVGHLTQGRYKALLVQKEGYLLELSRYIVLNPVRLGMVASPEGWPWSSYGTTAGLKKGEAFLYTDWILGCFSPSKAQARRLYISFVREGVGKESPLREAKGGVLLGGEGFIRKVRDLVEKSSGEEVVRPQRYAARLSLEEIFEGKERDGGIYEAIYRWGYKLKEVGEFLGLHYSMVSRIASRITKNKT
jgi:putative transposase